MTYTTTPGCVMNGHSTTQSDMVAGAWLELAGETKICGDVWS
ncbi:MAG: hypothetical protein AAGH74_05160 [Pseudomonadota bacterium]